MPTPDRSASQGPEEWALFSDQRPPKPYDKGGPGDHYPNERSISGRSCLPLMIAMIGIVIALGALLGGVIT